jgi:tetratricopeptide (TPR) repeat protein
MRHRLDVKRYEWAILTSLVLLAVLTPAGEAEQKALPEQQLNPHIALEVQAIQEQEKSGAEPLTMGRLWAQLAWDYERQMEYSKSEAAYNRALRFLERAPEEIDYAVALGNLGSLYMLVGNYGGAERCRKQALAIREAAGDKIEIARGKALLAEVYLISHKYKEAHRTAQEAYTSMVTLKDPHQREALSALITLVYAECFHGDCTSTLEHAREALSLARAGFAPDSVDVGHAHLALGFAEWKTAMKDGPDEEMRAGIEIMKGLSSPQRPYVLSALEQYRSYLEATNRKQEAKAIALEEAQLGDMRRDCANCTVSVYGLR